MRHLYQDEKETLPRSVEQQQRVVTEPEAQNEKHPAEATIADVLASQEEKQRISLLDSKARQSSRFQDPADNNSALGNAKNIDHKTGCLPLS